MMTAGADIRRPESTRPACAPGNLAGLDRLGAQAIALFCYRDVRPVAGVAGYVDWRICGTLSRTLASGRFHGERGEVMLLPAEGRLGRCRLFVFGLGDVADRDSRGMADVCRQAVSVMRQAGVDRVVFAAPSAPQRPEVEQEFLGVLGDHLAEQVEQVLVSKTATE